MADCINPVKAECYFTITRVDEREGMSGMEGGKTFRSPIG